MSLNISEAECSRDRLSSAPPPRVRRIAWIAAYVGLAVATSGCELVLGDIPPKRTDAAIASEDEAALEDDASVDAAEGPRDASSVPVDAARPDGSTPPHDAASLDGASTRADAGDVSSRDAAERDASAEADADREVDATPPAQAPDACVRQARWYRDDDGDGFGRSGSSSDGCAAPPGSWSLVDGDCDDQQPLVHPRQLEYFGEPYRSSEGALSFDYDCSGGEEGSGLQQAAPDSCGVLSLTACVGAGYSKTTRQGARVNRLCGSTVKETCQAAGGGLLFCETVTEPVADPYRCR